MAKAPKFLPKNTLSQLKRILSDLDGRFAIQDSYDLGSFVNYSMNSEEPYQNWYRYREGYSTRLLEHFAKECSYGELVVDPFCGGGATLIGASKLGLRSVGIDVNPLSVFISKVRVRHYTNLQVAEFRKVLEEIKEVSISNKPSSKPNLSIIDKVFLPDILHSLLVIKAFITTNLVRETKDFFFLAWLSILEEVSNIYKEGNGIKYRNRKRTKNGYIDIPIEKWGADNFPVDKFEYVKNKFLNRIKMMINDVQSLTQGEFQPEVYEGDAINIEEFIEPGSAKLICFSPPYMNNFNYFKSYKIELWMGDFVSSYEEMQALSKGSLRSHVETVLDRSDDENNWYPEELDTFIEMIKGEHLWTNRIPKAIRGYFYDMRKVISGLYDVLSKDGTCVIVVGNSAYGGILIPTDSLLAETAIAEGFDVDRIHVARHLTTSSQQKMALGSIKSHLRESIIVLKKGKSVIPRPTSKNGYIKYRYVSEIPKYPRDSKKLEYVIRNRNLTDLTHSFHKFPGKFIPHVPRWAIKKYLNGSQKIVFDPFVGSGTTLVEAMLAGHNAMGIDIDPLARLISKVKITPISPKLLQATVEKTVKLIKRRKVSKFRPRINNLDHWFTAEAANDLGIIREVIESWKDNKDLYDFLVVCFSSIIRRVSKADNQSLKTYVSGTHIKQTERAIPLFTQVLTDYSNRLIQFTEAIPKNSRGAVLQIEDSREVSVFWKTNGLPKVDLVITSPPYIKTVDYIYNQMAEYFWVGDLFGLDNQEKQNIFKTKYIGSDKVYSEQYLDSVESKYGEVSSLVKKIKQIDKKDGYIVNKYFEEMSDHFKQISKILKTTGRYVMVIGDSTVRGYEVPTSKIVVAIAKSHGFEVVQKYSYQIRNRYMRFPRNGRGGTVKKDWVISLKKV